MGGHGASQAVSYHRKARVAPSPAAAGWADSRAAARRGSARAARCTPTPARAGGEAGGVHVGRAIESQRYTPRGYHFLGPARKPPPAADTADA